MGISLQKIDAHVKEMVDDLVENHIRIYGRDHQVISTLLTVFSALQLDFDGKTIRGWLDTLLFGESQTGKSITATSILSMIKRGGYISGEGLSHVGLQGGIDKQGNSNVIRPGIFSIHDGELVIVDEMQGISKEEFGKLSDVRMSGVARIQKVKSFRAPARCRKIWTANPRPLESGSLTVKFSNDTFPINLVRKLIVTYEDMTRFDIIVGYKQSDFSLRKQQASTPRKNIYTPEIMSKMVNHVWSRSIHNYKFLPETVNACFDISEYLIENYTSDFPMILGAGQPDKMARLAAAAAGLFNLTAGETIEDYNNIVVYPEHVEWVSNWLQKVFKEDDLQYHAYAQAHNNSIKKSREDRKNIEKFIKKLPEYHELIYALVNTMTINEYQLRTQAPSIVNVSKLLSILTRIGLLKATNKGFYKTELLNDMLQKEFADGMETLGILDLNDF